MYLCNQSHLIGLFQRFICYTDLYCEGEFANFISILKNTLTYDLKNMFLKEGNEFNYINNLIGFIFRAISERFRIKENFYKNQINEFYDLIAESIKDYSEMTLEKNYASFVIEYCRFFAQGNKNLVKKFFGRFE